jgi:hypothetical protein
MGEALQQEAPYPGDVLKLEQAGGDKVKKEYIILAVVIVALALYLVLRSTDRTHYEIPEIDVPAKDSITKIDITGPAGTLTLTRAADVWLSLPEGYPLEKGKVDGMLDALSGLDVVSLVSEAESYTPYDLDPEKRVVVEASSGEQPLLKLDIGKAASTHRHTYVKLENDGNIYQVSGNIRRTFDVEVAALRDRKVLTLERDAITGFTVSAGGETLTLTKIFKHVEQTAEGQPRQPIAAWIDADSTEADGSVVDGMLGRVVNLQSDGFPSESMELDMNEPSFTLTLHGARDETLKIYGASGEKMFVATSSQYAFPFMLAEWRLNQINKTPSELMGQVDEEE